ncbi:MAG TPA: hypothetical protein VF184_10225, partial [Phycisphaeraceae bacterium]
EIVEVHYEKPELYEEPALTKLERRLERYLGSAWAQLCGRVTLVEPSPNETRASLVAKVGQVTADPVQTFFEGSRFSRLMEGRLRFYGTPVPGFDVVWLVRNELGRIVQNFYDKPLRACGESLLSSPGLSADQVLERLQGRLLSDEDARGMRRFAQLAAIPYESGREREQARQVASVYAPVLRSLETIGAHLLQAAPTPNADRTATIGTPSG